MTESRVGTLRLHVQVPAVLAASAPEIQRVVERDVMVRVLEELERLLHAELGAVAVVRIRHLAVRWRLDAGELVEPSLIARLARDVARGLVEELARTSPRERLRPRPDLIAVFADEAHATAALLADAATDLPAHWVHGGDSADGAWTRAAARGEPALAAVASWLVQMEQLDGAVVLAPEPVRAALAAAAPVAAAAIARDQARRAAARAASHQPPSPMHAPGAGASARSGATDGLDPGAPIPSPTSAPAIAVAATAAPNERATGPAIAAIERAEAGDASIEIAPARATGEVTPAGIEAATTAAGLFYLAGRVLEIDLAERLWAVGLPEGDVLAHVAGALLGELDDPAWRWFGGVFDRAPATPAVPAWAAMEIADTVRDALGRRLVRFGAAQTPAQLAARLDHLALAFAPAWPVDPTLAAVVARAAAALAAMACARLAIPASAAAVRAICTRPGHLVRTDDELRVIVPARHVDVDHRRAGLDHDPGHVPWLRRALRIEFAGVVDL